MLDVIEKRLAGRLSRRATSRLSPSLPLGPWCSSRAVNTQR